MATYAECPFYEKEKDHVLFCEGAEVHFPTNRYHDLWMNMHCFSSKYQICKYYIELMEKYDSED